MPTPSGAAIRTATAVRTRVPTIVGKMPPAAAHVDGIAGQERQVEDRQALAQDEDDDEQQHDRRVTAVTQHEDAPGPRSARAVGADAHAFSPSAAADVALAIVFRIMMMTNSTTPVAKRAWRCSPRRVAHLQGDVGGQRAHGVERSSRGSATALPATMITAMVSPTARPMPRMIAATMPERAALQHDHVGRLPARGAQGDRALPVSRAARPEARRRRC